MTFQVLGPVEVRSGDRNVPLPAGQAPQLLAVLLLDVGRVVPVEALMGVLWDGEFPASARKLVQVRMSQLRAALAATPAVLTGVRGGYRLDVDPASVDLARFRSLRRRARDVPPAAAERLLREAIELWRGPAVPELRHTVGGQRLAVPLDEEYLAAVEDCAAGALAADAGADLVEPVRAALLDHPLRERLRALLMRLLYRAGRRAAAIELYDEGRRLLADELGLDPGADLRAAYREILDADREPSAPAPRPRPAGPAQLPADVADFTGRTGELSLLSALVRVPDPPGTGRDPGPAGTGPGAATAVAAVTGTAGVGKTVLVVHWAHQHAADFPDGQLYVDLRGFDPHRAPVEASDAVRSFVEALGVPPAEVPADPDAQAALYRSLLAGRRALVLLDNARDSDQARPLLPGAGASVALVTSRVHLSGLVASDGAGPLRLDVPAADEARGFLAGRLGRSGIAADTALLDEIIRRCAGLPLALALVAARAAAHPASSLPGLVAELGDEAAALDALDGGDATTDLRAVFSWSYDVLSPAAAAVFRRAGRHPGPDVTLAAAASLAGIGARQARVALHELVRAHLIVERTTGRYGSHDLLRAYAAELADADDPVERRAAFVRTLDHYLHTARAAYLLLRPYRGVVRLDGPVPGVTVAELATVQDALAWFTAERDTLDALVRQAAAAGFARHTWQLAVATADFLQRRGPWTQLAALMDIAVRAAAAAGDRTGLAHARHQVAQTHHWLGEYAAAQQQYQRALDLFAEVGDLVAQGHVEADLGLMFERRDEPAAALDHTNRSLAHFQAAGHRVGEGLALNNVGWLHALRGDYEAALDCCRRSRGLLRAANEGYAEANVWDTIGYINDRLGRQDDAVHAYRRALTLFTEAGDLYYAADTLTHLGAAQRHAGDVDGARESWTRALRLLEELGHADATAVRASLDELG
ncbi:SARP family transcriptional regulator [Actinocatenispora thailandica]|uniref:SARP family transcriptional regulator n=1 Tax=Actinocatenispora thailandica TaxID=227318 RepID=A0A7R7DKY5_9ACTN|nr:SARP family transcriptional regulator [Actinocatenispora thailandica]